MIQRFGISLENDLLHAFDKRIQKKGYKNRSEAIRDLIRDSLIEEEFTDGNKQTNAIVMIVYDHHQYNLAQKMTGIQHEHHDTIIASLHSHLDKHNCLEVILLKGKAGELQHIADSIISTNGVKYGKFIPATAGDVL
ncbi:MAG: nickel-responsive transcriptional regulator NikR [Spirochaetales bacterium]|nr:nickel-responsive transcriptional regulator NikR [Spirochaetales bacterium]